MDLVLINPNSREQVYQSLGMTLTAVEPPIWAGLMATFVRNHGFEVAIIDAEAEQLSHEETARRALDMRPRLIGVVAYGHQPSASTQVMPAASKLCEELTGMGDKAFVMLLGGHVAALPERTVTEEAVDGVAGGEGLLTILDILAAQKEIRGLYQRGDFRDQIVKGPPASLVDVAEMPAPAWDLLPMHLYRAHNWHCFGGKNRQPYAAVYTTLGCPYKCLAGDTLVNTIYGEIPIKELAEKYGDAGVPVYTYDPDTCEAFIANAINIRKYGEGEQLVRVTFDDGTHMDVTPDHQFLQFKLKGGRGPKINPLKQWPCEAKDLVKGARVRAIRKEVHPAGYVSMAWGRHKSMQRSRMIVEFLLGRKLARTEQVHHKDRNKGNDHPNNLEYCENAAAHFRNHPEIAERMRDNNPTKNGMSQSWIDKIAHSVRGKRRTLEQRIRYSESKMGKKNPNFKDGSSVGRSRRLKETNHRVVSVEWLTEKADVYCMSVPKTGWFFANNVLVKNCSFCCIQAPFRQEGDTTNSYRMWSPKVVVDNLEHLHTKYGVVNIKFADEMFVLNRRHVEGICDLIIERGLPLNIWAYARVDTAKDVALLAKLKRAGFNWLAFGIESADAGVREGVAKGFKQSLIYETIQKVKDAGIHIGANYIFGLPDDDMASMRKTLDLACELNTEWANFYGTMAYPGSPLYEQVLRERPQDLPKTWGQYSQHAKDSRPLPTKHLTSEQVLRFRDEAFETYFRRPEYLHMMAATFGQAATDEITHMLSFKLERDYKDAL